MRTLPTTRVSGLCRVGVDAALVTVEGRFEAADRTRMEVALTGLADAVVRESRSRVMAALEANRLRMPSGRLYVHLAPAGVRKTGEGLDLPLALCAAAATGHIPARRLADVLFLGELGLDGRLQDVPGGLAAAELARREGLGTLVAPPGTAREAALLGHGVLAAKSLAQVLGWLMGGEPLRAPPPEDARPEPPAGGTLDLVRGHGAAKRALCVAAAGGHGLLMIGPPGTGKSLLARGLLRLLPPPTDEERLEITKVRSATGRFEGGLARGRPFRAPHHSTSLAGLIGGGNPIQPGEITLAHRGLLFLDELPEFRRETLESLRQPLESGEVLIARAGRQLELPASFRVVAAMNPCPCGYRGQTHVVCRCSPAEIHRYRRRVSGPLLDRIELRVEVSAPRLAELAVQPCEELREPLLRERVEQAVERARARQGPRRNAQLDAGELDQHAPLDRAGTRFLEQAAERRLLSARALQALRRVARTLADLEGDELVGANHLAQAAGLRAPLLE